MDITGGQTYRGGRAEVCRRQRLNRREADPGHGVHHAEAAEEQQHGPAPLQQDKGKYEPA